MTAINNNTQVCQGHKIDLGRTPNRNKVRDISAKAVEKYAQDVNVSTFTTSMKEVQTGLFRRKQYEVIGNLKHVNNCSACDKQEAVKVATKVEAAVIAPAAVVEQDVFVDAPISI